MAVREGSSPLKEYFFVRRKFKLSRLEHRFFSGGVEFLIGVSEGLYKAGIVDAKTVGIYLWCLPDNRLVLAGYGQDWYREAHSEEHQLLGELRRISNLKPSELEDFIRQRGGYNPFLDRRRRAVVETKDLRIREKYGAAAFKDSPRFSASTKRSLVHSVEKFVTARKFGGEGYAVSRYSPKIAVALDTLSPRMLEQTSGRMEDSTFRSFLRLLENLNEIVKATKDRDLAGALAEIGKSYNKGN